MKRSRHVLQLSALVMLLLVLVVAMAACSSEASSTNDDVEAVAEDPAVSLIETKCSLCHSVDWVWSAEMDQEGWVSTIGRMKNNGLVITDDEYDQIIDYLVSQ